MMEKLDKIPGGNPFKVPENYFEEVQRKIVLATSGKGTDVGKPVFSTKLKPWLRIAASVTILCLLTFSGMLYFSHRERTVHPSAFSSEEFQPVLLEEIDITSLEENITLEGVPAMGYQVDSNDIVDYLLSDNIDITEIEDHF
jgi:hypothetical protein